jgi:hypothetical protein
MKKSGINDQVSIMRDLMSMCVCFNVDRLLSGGNNVVGWSGVFMVGLGPVNCCWASPAQSFLVPGPAGTKLCCS